MVGGVMNVLSHCLTDLVTLPPHLEDLLSRAPARAPSARLSSKARVVAAVKDLRISGFALGQVFLLFVAQL